MITLPTLLNKKHATLIAFAENQLSPKSVSFSLPAANYPSLMQQTRVRPSSITSNTFSLFTAKSFGFGSKSYNSIAFSDSISLRLPYVKLVIQLN